jgi:twinkle protein
MPIERNRVCPKCREVGHDKKGDHLFLMSDGTTWTCIKDNLHQNGKIYYEVDGEEVSGPGKKVDKTQGHIDVSEFGPATIRKIPKEIIDKYEIKVEFDTSTGEQKKHYYPITTDRGRNIVAYKVRTLPKDFSIVPRIGNAKVDLFGMRSSAFAPRVIVITEGELDAPAAYQMLHRHVQKLMCIGLPFGANLKAVMDNIKFLQEADDIVFAGDQDDPGQAIVEKLSMILPTIRIMKYSEKDPCAMLEEGKLAEFRDAFGVAKTHTPSSIVSVEDIEEEALEPVEWGLDYPFKGLTQLTYGLMPGSIIGIGAGPGAGKTSFIKEIETHLIFQHKQKIGILAFEEAPHKTLRSLGGHLIGKPVWLPDCDYNENELKDAIESLRGLVHIYDHRGYREWIDVEQTMLYMCNTGIYNIFVDPLSALTAHLDSAEANTYLNNAMFVWSKMVQSMPLNIFHVNHLNNPQTGKDHGAGGRVYGSQFTGSRAMWKYSTDLWGLERDQLNDDINIRNTVRVVILKNRLSGDFGSINLRYNRRSGRLEEVGLNTAAASFTSVINK